MENKVQATIFFSQWYPELQIRTDRCSAVRERPWGPFALFNIARYGGFLVDNEKWYAKRPITLKVCPIFDFLGIFVTSFVIRLYIRLCGFCLLICFFVNFFFCLFVHSFVCS